ncbi:S41 family peptidase [Kutzneria buriramensis]|uniref:Peptidase S41-like protein n=1 Tax=Kutzneria buriramensis TaxID=1045776 RepID=A0A3E0I0B3_9PSEU|nr:S41 family peptidase [Kutzneria buriramensis]REH52158.1 peptidase S41-like protein [Kutzneria buriramensis]
MSPVEEALELLRTRAYYADRVDWESVTDAALAVMSSGGTLREALRLAFASLGDRHSRLVGAGMRAQGELPSGEVVKGVGVLRLPGVRGEGGDYARVGREVLRRPARAWVVDLRGNTGGNIRPMLAVVDPLLGDADFLSYERRTGERVRFGNRTQAVDLTDLPVAVLHDGRTASSAEGVVVAFRGRPLTRSFGAATAGVPTGNVLCRLSDGSALAITTSVAVDRRGRRHESAIEPDEGTGDPLRRAVEWLGDI